MSKLEIVSPYNLDPIEERDMNNADDVERALETAEALFNDRSQWLKPHKRIAVLEETARLMSERVEELTRTAANEGGKPYRDSKAEVLRAINGVKIAAAEIANLKGEQVPMGLTEASENRWGYTMREPIGVVAAVSAFNHPLNLIVHQVVTAFAAGCPVIVKPALNTPLSCIGLVDIMKEVGCPDGWIQVLLCSNEHSEQLVTDKRVHFFTFIGSGKVGWYLRSKLAPGTRCALEHGGAAPVIVEKDVKFKPMIPLLTKGGFYHAGQVCVSVQRVFAHESLAEDLADKLSVLAEDLRVGDPLDEQTDVGPLISPGEVDRVEEWVQEALDAGATLLCGGERLSDTCYKPTVLLNPPEDAKVSQLEIFGPVVCVYSFKDRDEAIRRANALDVHFQAAVFTQNIDTALDAVQKLDATAVMVNDHTAFRVDWMPFGGRDESGIGMGGIPHSMHDMTREKLMVIKSSVL